MSYTDEFYDVIADGCLNSARAVVPEVIKLFGLTVDSQVADFGCGQGWWLSVFKQHGMRVEGFDGDYVDRSRLAIDPSEFTGVDLARVSPPLGHQVDMVMSLEVAEHLPESVADRFVDDLCWASGKILFSAAIPAQGGTGHVNEQWPEYWVAKFGDRGYTANAVLQQRFWSNPEVECWYAQNMLMFTRHDLPDLIESVPVRRHVHPQFWQARVIEA